MLRLASYDIVFQEIPGEVTLALNLSGCPNGCPGCHSPHLQEQAGEPLDERLFGGLLEIYAGSVTCVCFMGGDAEPGEVDRLAAFTRRVAGGRLKTGWYSGRQQLAGEIDPGNFDFIKLGPYVSRLGGLDSPQTNQRFYKIVGGRMEDITSVFRRMK
ncbi:MAG: anaerobic ribonucleoside-triphosphate reductase activating protein [Alistipes sp.]|nr:anaerobic ribonucleoside-triphosphate reductase activating protein [Alistipes sp.]